MAIIKRLEEKIANQIAAGEVVDRPASIVKELVENSIDAKATEITIEVINYGLDLIKVVDNGQGMEKLDLKEAFFRHATSKIYQEDDLIAIKTLGFRGEAIPAISSVSQMKIASRQNDSSGYEVIYHGGEFYSEGLATVNKGTLIEVRNLFYNTPARYKYIKSEQAERRAIMEVFDKLAIGHPQIRMTLIMDGKVLKTTYGINEPKALIQAIYGQSFTKNLVYLNEKIEKIEIELILVSPQNTVSNKRSINIYINGRAINNYILREAVINGYHSKIMVNRYPIAVVKIKTDYQLVDVNIHPQKLEVKLVNEYFLASLVEKLIKDSLVEKVYDIPSNLTYQKAPNNESFTATQIDFLFEEEINLEDDLKKIPDFDFVGILAGTYLLFQNEKGLYLMDQHAAQERVRYEHYFNVMNNPNFAVKAMLIPYELKINKSDLLIIEEHQKNFAKYGFEFNSDNELIGLPTWLLEQEIELAILFLLEKFVNNQTINLIDFRDHLAKDISCKGSVRANQHLSSEEIYRLVADLKKAKSPYTCPHGRPTIILLTNYEIEKMFKRIV
ncbi:MAG: DNA mismatch repair endonuclease MutL [Acholeplasmataceae bacterium]|nr:DNA mismatch repair endonuclease MutL [Acholeplasmataceae bacterium]